MAINPLQLPVWKDVPRVDFSPLAGIGEAIQDYRSRSALADNLPGILNGSEAQSGTPLNALGQQPQQQSAPQQNQSPYAGAIAKVESGGDYNALGPITNPQTGNRALGKYQVMASNVAPWTQEVLGKALTPQEFLANPQAQDAVFQAKFGSYVQKYGPDGAARAWFAGEGGMNDPNRKDQIGTSVSDYSRRFNSALGPQGGAMSFAGQPQAAPQQAPTDISAQARMPQPQTPQTIQQSGVPPETVARLQAMIRAGGSAERMALALIQKYAEPKYGFQTLPDGTVLRTDQNRGTVAPIYQSNKPSFSVIGKDQNGNDVHGFVDTANSTVRGIDGKPVSSNSAIGQQPNSQLTGDEYLKTLDPGRAAQVKAIVEGRMAPPGGFALKSPQVMAIMRDAAQYEPGFDFTKWTQRNSTVRDFASGKGAQNVTALNTVMGHLGDLAEKADALKNYGGVLTPLNTVTNMVADKTGDPRIKNFDMARNAVSDELARVFRSAGMSDSEIRQWKENISANNSPEQLKGVIKTAVGLIESRLAALGEQRNNGFSTKLEPSDLLNPKAKEQLEKVRAWANGEQPAKAQTKPEAKPNAAQEQPQMPSYSTPQEAYAAMKAGKLKSGDQFMTPDGQIRIAK